MTGLRRAGPPPWIVKTKERGALGVYALFAILAVGGLIWAAVERTEQHQAAAQKRVKEQRQAEPTGPPIRLPQPALPSGGFHASAGGSSVPRADHTVVPARRETARPSHSTMSDQPTRQPSPATPSRVPVPRVSVSPLPLPSVGGFVGGMSAAEAEVFRLVNVERAKVGCNALVPNMTVTNVARAHSANMAEQDDMSHELDGRDAGDRLHASGLLYSGWGENIARGYDTPAEVMSGWMSSPGHRENILDCSFTTLGVGVADGPRGPWWTQDFIEV